MLIIGKNCRRGRKEYCVGSHGMNRRRRYYHAAEKRSEPYRSIINRRIPYEEENGQGHGSEPEAGRDPQGKAGAGPGRTVHIGERKRQTGLRPVFFFGRIEIFAAAASSGDTVYQGVGIEQYGQNDRTGDGRL